VLRDSGETFELAHDTLAHKIFENRSEEEKRREEVQARLLTSFKEYQESGTYLNAPQIARLEEWLPLLRLSPAEADFVAASRAAVEARRNKEREEAEKERRLRKRAQIFSYIASIVAVVAIGSLYLGYYSFLDAQTARKDANIKLVTALKEKNDRLDLQLLNANRALKVYEKAGHESLIVETKQEIERIIKVQDQTRQEIQQAQ